MKFATCCTACEDAMTLLLTPRNRGRSELEHDLRLGNNQVTVDVWHIPFTYEDLKALVAHSKDLVLIDVRSQDEVNRGKIPGSIHIPIQTVDAALAMTPDEFKAKYGVTKPALGDSELVFYCQSGGRGARATSRAREKGYINARNYAGAYSEWSRRQRN